MTVWLSMGMQILPTFCQAAATLQMIFNPQLKIHNRAWGSSGRLEERSKVRVCTSFGLKIQAPEAIGKCISGRLTSKVA